MAKSRNRRAKRRALRQLQPQADRAVAPADDACVEDAQPEAEAPISNDNAFVLPEVEDTEPPFDPPDPDDEVFRGGDRAEDSDAEAETECLAAANDERAEPACEPADETALCVEDVTELVVPDAIEDAPAAAPETQPEPEPAPEVQPEPEATASLEPAELDPPFDAPDPNDDEVFHNAPLAHSNLPVLELRQLAEPEPAPLPPNGEERRRAEPVKPFGAGAKPEAVQPKAKLTERPVPPISVYASWDRPEIAHLLADLAADRHLAQAETTVERGGLDGALVRACAEDRPDLFIVDSTLAPEHLLEGVERFKPAILQGARVIVIGAVNDISLFRELAARGVSEYLVPRFRRSDLLHAVCRLYADTDKSRVIAVVGARGGVGASTIAHNLAWSIAERQDAGATLVDLDLGFGAAAFNFQLKPELTAADALADPDQVDDALLQHPAAQRLQILPAPAALEHAGDLDVDALDAMLARVRRSSPFVVLDLPHAWTPWIKHTLTAADDVVIVASPDLAGLRNTKNMLDALNAARPRKSPPRVALSMVGVPKRPEVLLKDFTESIGAAPVAAFDFDPKLFGMAEVAGKMLGEADPQSKSALAIDALATALTGREPLMHKRMPRIDAPALEPLPAPTPAPSEPAAVAPPPFDTEETGDLLALMQAPAPAPAPEPDPAPTHTMVQVNLPFDPPLATPANDHDAPLELTTEATGDYIERAREAALNEVRAQRAREDAPEAAPRRMRIRTVLARAAAVLLIGGATYLEVRHVAPGAAPTVQLASLAPAPAHAAAPSPDDFASRYQGALDLISAQRAEDAAPVLRRLADSGFAPAQYRLAKLYESGEGVGADLAQARFWTERAATAGNRRAMHDLGVYFARGEGAPVDETAAFRWFRQAAELGVADSQFNLGVLYQQGRAVSASAEEAMFWFTLAANQGDETARARVAALEVELTPPQLEQARARAQAFQPRLANPAANGPAAQTAPSEQEAPAS